MRSSEIRYAKDWRLRKMLTSLRKAQQGNRSHPNGLSRLMEEHLRDDIAAVEAELKRRKATPDVMAKET